MMNCAECYTMKCSQIKDLGISSINSAELTRSDLKIAQNVMISNELLINLEQLHTTELGVLRIKKNLSLDTDDVVEWCKMKIHSSNAVMKRNGKNWYVIVDGCIITINAYSFTIITAHNEKK